MRIFSTFKLKNETFHSGFVTERPGDMTDIILWCFDCKREHILLELERIDLGKDLDYKEPDDLWAAFNEECMELNDSTFHTLAERLKGTGVSVSAMVHPWSLPDYP